MVFFTRLLVEGLKLTQLQWSNWKKFLRQKNLHYYIEFQLRMKSFYLNLWREIFFEKVLAVF